MYVEPIKVVQMNLFTGQEWRCRHREWVCGDRSGVGDGMNREIETDIYTLSCERDS